MSPLLEDVSLESAKAVLYNITAPQDISAEEIQEVGDIIHEAAPEDANIIFGVVFDEEVGDEIRITVVATGIEPTPAVESKPAPAVVTPFNKAGANAVRTEARRVVRAEQPPVYGQSAYGDQGIDAQVRPVRRQSRAEEIGSWYNANSNDYPFVMKGDRRRQQRHAPGQEDFLYNENDCETPLFLRTQAD